MNAIAKRLLTAMLSVAILCPVMAGCGEDSSNSSSSGESASADSGTSQTAEESLFNEPGTLPISKEPITLTAAIRENGLVTDYNDNALTNWIAEQTNIRLEFTTYPNDSAEARQKIELAITSKQELPGIIFNFGFTDVAIAEYGEAGIFLDTSEFLKNDAYYFNAPPLLQGRQKEALCV